MRGFPPFLLPIRGLGEGYSSCPSPSSPYSYSYSTGNLGLRGFLLSSQKRGRGVWSELGTEDLNHHYQVVPHEELGGYTGVVGARWPRGLRRGGERSTLNFNWFDPFPSTPRPHTPEGVLFYNIIKVILCLFIAIVKKHYRNIFSKHSQTLG